jgi:hypothetical protein
VTYVGWPAARPPAATALSPTNVAATNERATFIGLPANHAFKTGSYAHVFGDEKGVS